MVQRAHLGNADDPPAARRLDFTRERGGSLERAMATRLVIVGEIGPQEVFEMSLVKHGDLAQALAADGADKSLDL